VRKVTGQNDQPKADFEALTAQDEQRRSITAEAQTDKHSMSGLEQESKKVSERVSDNVSEKSEKEFEKASQGERSFVELQMRADAVDKVMTKNGPPELDLNSG
jgi:hypothetical protein